MVTPWFIACCRDVLRLGRKNLARFPGSCGKWVKTLSLREQCAPPRAGSRAFCPFHDNQLIQTNRYNIFGVRLRFSCSFLSRDLSMIEV